MIARAIGAKVLEDTGKRCVGHSDLEKIVAKWDLSTVSELKWLSEGSKYHAIICTRFTTERQRLFRDSFVDDSMWEHRLTRDSEDECTERSVITRFALSPHTSERVNFRRLSIRRGRQERAGTYRP